MKNDKAQGRHLDPYCVHAEWTTVNNSDLEVTVKKEDIRALAQRDVNERGHAQ
jgi:hypothetical protein